MKYLFGRMKAFFKSHPRFHVDVLEDFEQVLYESDIGIKTTQYLLDALQQEMLQQQHLTLDFIEDLFKALLVPRLRPLEKTLILDGNPSIIMVVGVNGTGKTTTIAKIASRLANHKKVLLVAADTFRAAAIDQLCHWGEKLNLPVFSGREGTDPSSVVFDALEHVKHRTCDVVLIDTAGRMHTNQPLMEELKKMKRVVQKYFSQAPHEILFVMDAHTGHNAIYQCRQFQEALNITGMILTKLDGTARGGMLLTIAEELSIPIPYVAAGEKISDLFPFDASVFLEMMFERAHAEERNA